MDVSEPAETNIPDVEMEFMGELDLVDDLGHLEPSAEDTISQLLLTQMGSSGRSYAREKAAGSRRIL